MARTSRLVVADFPHHIIQRGSNKVATFIDDLDRQKFLSCLGEGAKRFKVAIHAYVLMGNHFHLLVTPSDTQALGRMMQWVGRFYVPYFNRKYGRTGPLWEGRFKASVIDSEQYFLICSRYIELNPVRAGLVTYPSAYPWSSYAHHVGNRLDSLISDHPLYWAMGNTPFEREAAYRQYLSESVAQAQADEVGKAALKGLVLGSNAFKLALERKMRRRVMPAKRGRPSKGDQTSDPT